MESIVGYFAKWCNGLFNEHKINEASYKMELKTRKEAYPKFVYEFPFVTPKDSFIKSNMDQFQVGINEGVDEV